MASCTKKGSVLKELRDEIKRALDDGANPIAAFDADGTLWDTDIGENFFKHQAENKLVDLPEDPWAFYEEWHERDPIPAYLWLAQINKDRRISEVRSWAAAALERYDSVPVFPHMRELVMFLKELGVKVYIVTASVKWAVEPAARLVGLEPEDVIGITTKIDSEGVVQEEQDGPVTWREGKVEGLLQATKNKAPFFAAGNTTGDVFLLESATHLALAHCFTAADNPIHQTELDLLARAKELGWRTHTADHF